MSDIKKLFKQSSHYFMGQMLLMVSGVISFPILTRVFSISDYGVLNLVSATLMFIVAFGKFGLQNATIRFYEEFKSAKRGEKISQFYSTLLFGSVLIAGGITFLFLVYIKLVPFDGKNIYILKLLSFVAVLIFTRCVLSILTNFLRAEQNTKMYNIINLIQKYCSLSLSIFFVFYFIKGLYGFYFGMIIVELIIMFFLVYRIFKKHLISFKQISISFLKESIKYGLPLISYEFSGIILMYADKFLIQFYLNSKAVGIYSAGYNLCTYVAHIVTMPLILSLSPIYINIWTNKGKVETKIFLSKTLKYFLLIAIPLAVGLIAIDKEIIGFLASTKYMQSYVVIPYIIIGLITTGANSILGAGMFIYKKTYLLTILVFVCGFLNVIMNIILIPKLGIMGAAISTLAAYVILLGLITVCSFNWLKFKIKFVAIGKYILFSLLMYIIVKNISIDNSVFNLIVKILGGMISYSLLIVCFDSTLRKSLLKYIQG